MKEKGGYEGERRICRRKEDMREKGGYDGLKVMKEKGGYEGERRI